MRRLLGVLAAMVVLGTAQASSESTSLAANASIAAIAAQPLKEALISFGRATGLQMIYESELTTGQYTQGAPAGLTATEALDRLLDGTGLVYRVLNKHTVSIRAAGDAASDAGVTKPAAAVIAAAEGVSQSSRSQGEGVGEDRKETSSSSASSDADKSKVEEIIVTAQKREERLQDVPISISVLDGAKLDSAPNPSLLQALASVPGVTMREYWQGNSTSLSIRGVAPTAPYINGASPIGFYLDSLPFGFIKQALVPDLNPYDLERVEVLRGPQGTLYGASSLNGVVRVLTNVPDLSSFDVKARTSVSSTKVGGESYRGDVALNFPIATGKLAARVVAGYEDRAGWVDAPGSKDINGAKVSNVRLKLRAKPVDNLDMTFSVWHSKFDGGASNISDDNDQRTSSLAADEYTLIEYDTYNGLISYAFPAFTLSSATSYIDYSNESDVTLAESFPGLPFFDTNMFLKSFSQEILLNSSDWGSWRYSLGFAYRKVDERLLQFFALNDQTDTSRSTAVFGQLTKMLLDDLLELTAGIRYFSDTVTNENPPGAVNTPQFPTIPYQRSEGKFHKLSPKATLTWHPRIDAAVYASYGEGFRSGYGQNTFTTQQLPGIGSVGPDTLKNYELGAKIDLADGRVDFEGAVFYIDWRDAQQVVSIIRYDENGQIIGGFPAALNAAAIAGGGIDAALTIRPLAGLQLSLNYNRNNLEFRTPVLSGGEVLFPKGTTPPQSAKETVGGSVLYRHNLANGWVGRIDASANYHSELTSVFIANGAVSNDSSDSILLARSSLSLDLPEHWTITGFVENLTNNRRQPSLASVVQQWQGRLRPRTFGLQFEYKF